MILRYALNSNSEFDINLLKMQSNVSAFNRF
jgi:hypothetical protein